VPAGVEELAADCAETRRVQQPDPSVHRDQVSLGGRTVREALDELVSHDRRYAWMDSDGVIIVRPVAAWADRGHFLARAIPSFASEDQHVFAAFDEWRWAMRGQQGVRELPSMRADPRTDETARKLTISTGAAATAGGALDTIVRAHGKMAWRVAYCRPESAPQFATVWLLSHDNAEGHGVPLPERYVTVGDKLVDACRAP
jgi:hypothetical protein